MPNFRKVVRSAVHTALSHATTGFNAQLAAIASAYGVTAFTLDWSLPSKNVAFSFLEEGDGEETSSLTEYPACLIYCGRAENQWRVKGKKFSGTVAVRVSFILRYRALTDAVTAGNTITHEKAMADTESIADAVNDAALEAIYAGGAAFQSAGVFYSTYVAEPSPVEPLGDGYRQRVDITLGFEVL